MDYSAEIYPTDIASDRNGYIVGIKEKVINCDISGYTIRCADDDCTHHSAGVISAYVIEYAGRIECKVEHIIKTHISGIPNTIIGSGGMNN